MTTRSVLVADDNLTIQRVASEMLSGAGLEVVTVANGMAAIKKLADIKPLVVLADTDMPGKDGYEVCDYVKRQPELGYVRVLLAVGEADPFDEARGAQAGVDGIVKKPFERDDLVASILRYVGEAEALCPPPSPAPSLPDPWQSTNNCPAAEAATPESGAGLTAPSEFRASFVASSSFPDSQGFPAEFPEPAGPPVVDWPASGAPEVQLESPTPVAESCFDAADGGPDAEPEYAEFHGSDPPAAAPVAESKASAVIEDVPPEPPLAENGLLEPPDSAHYVAPPPWRALPTEPALIGAEARHADAAGAAPAECAGPELHVEHGSTEARSLETFADSSSARDAVAGDCVRHDEGNAGTEAVRLGEGNASAELSLDRSLVASVVQRVVARMAPRGLSQELVKALEEELTQEVLLELKSIGIS
ncbi:MAG: response regulator [Terriglobia bacterium]